ncbi:MAG TPA: CBS domain-containing protein, partial [Campylobacterales bacterium]|nr:CBS domain-containing protein [Campylobacterales bacterium]
IKEVMESEPNIFKFSRIPVYRGSIEDVTGIVLTKRLFKQSMEDDSVSLYTIQDKIHSIHENLPVTIVLDMFIKKKQHMFLVKDSYDQTEGIVTLEDCVETLLGIEIMDESDTTEDMRHLAKLKMKKKRREEKLRDKELEDKESQLGSSQFS